LLDTDEDMNDVISKICSLAHDYFMLANKSMNQLLEESGYFHSKDFITTEKIIEGLRENPNLISDWEKYSDFPPASQGWLFYKNDSTQWIVVYYDACKRPPLEKEQIFSSAFEACATYILIELANLDKLATQQKTVN
jgi:hypothetical protein